MGIARFLSLMVVQKRINTTLFFGCSSQILISQNFQLLAEIVIPYEFTSRSSGSRLAILPGAHRVNANLFQTDLRLSRRPRKRIQATGMQEVEARTARPTWAG